MKGPAWPASTTYRGDLKAGGSPPRSVWKGRACRRVCAAFYLTGPNGLANEFVDGAATKPESLDFSGTTAISEIHVNGGP